MNAAGASEMKQQHGAVVVKSGRVLSIGINKLKNNPEHVVGYGLCSIHAEADAISRVKNPRGAAIYIARVNNNGEPRLSRPCDDCAKMIRDVGISKIVYTD